MRYGTVFKAIVSCSHIFTPIKLRIMNTHYTKNDTAAEIVSDLINIHNDRIAGYELVINKVTDLDSDLKFAFQEMISKANEYKAQLAAKMKDIPAGNKKTPTLFGTIYRAWVDLKMTFTGNTRKAVISYCRYNEDIAQHAYNAALNIRVAMNSDIRLLIEQQQEELEQSYNKVKACREEHHFSVNSRLVYFN